MWLIQGQASRTSSLPVVTQSQQKFSGCRMTTAAFFTQTWPCYVREFAVAILYVVCNVRAPYSFGWNFWQSFYALRLSVYLFTLIHRYPLLYGWAEISTQRSRYVRVISSRDEFLVYSCSNSSHYSSMWIVRDSNEVLLHSPLCSRLLTTLQYFYTIA